jgi:hypothetical protein
MKARLIPTAAAVAFALAPVAPVWSGEVPDTTATVRDDARTAGHAVAHGATTTGHAIADKSREAGHAIADGTRSTRDTIRDDSKKTGHAVADGARRVGRTVKEGIERLKASMKGKTSEPAPKS